ncbi:MAG: efflux transporter outer membrane subunit [Gallionella sp.]|nr:efflux transporter outer membrane subunit [Gallionella sp.]MDD4959068.1 efflux transporter outer membrane subunit [Gallionella sp.]
MNISIRTTKASYRPSSVLLLIAFALSGCSSNPDIPTSSISLKPNYLHGGGLQNSAPDGDQKWWQQFGDKQLALLVERAAIANHDVRIAVERAKQARAGTGAVDSRLFPSVNLVASQSDTRTSLPAMVKQSMLDTRASRVGVDVAWEIDLFGGARAAASAAEKDAAAAKLGIAGAQLIVASEVARQYFIWHGARQRLNILQSLLQTQRDTECLTRSRNREGMASEFDVARAAGETLSMEASLPQLHTLMSVTESRIAVLTGASASTLVPELHVKEEFHWISTQAPFSGQPADLLRRRPDILAAEQQLSAESSRLVEAKANRFPKLFLSALFGQQALTLNNTLSLSASRYSNVAGAFVLPIFNAGHIKAGIEAQTAREQQVLLSYEQTILNAVEDVENSLAVLTGEQQRIDALTAAEKEREIALEHARSLFREGQIDLLQLLDVQRALLATELTLTESHAQRAVSYVQLYKALGGGWQALPLPANAQIATNSLSGVKQ